MKRAHWLMAATAALLPWPAAAQDCGAAIRTVEKNLQKVPQDEWYRAQVQLYLAEQFQQKGVPESCFRAVREASNIVGMPPPAAAADSSGGMEGKGKTPSPEQAVKLVGKPVQSTSGEKLGKIVDVIGKERGPLRFVMATDGKNIPVQLSKLRYDKSKDVVIVSMTKAQVKDAGALGGGVELNPTDTAEQ